MKVDINYPRDFAHTYSCDEFNNGKSEIRVREPSTEELSFAVEIICSYICHHKSVVISAKFDREEQAAKCTMEDKTRETLF